MGSRIVLGVVRIFAAFFHDRLLIRTGARSAKR